MSVFKKVIEAHCKAEIEAENSAAAATAAQNAAKIEFVTSFNNQIKQVAEPIFLAFIADALEYGFPAEVEHGRDGADNPTYTLKIIPYKNATFGTNKSLECVYRIRGLVVEQKIELASYFDQRPGENGKKMGIFTIQSINTSLFEQELSEFFSAALKARAD